MENDLTPETDCTDTNETNNCIQATLLPLNACVCELASTQFKPEYATFNLILIVIILPTVAAFGVITNALALYVYTRSHMLTSTTNFYLAALAISDIFVDICGISSIAIDSARRFDPLLNEIHLNIIPYTLPLCYIAQMCSVYFTVLAAFDCYLTVCRPQETSTTMNNNQSKLCSRNKTLSKLYVVCVVSVCFVYNGITFADLHVVECVDYSQPNVDRLKREICPTDLRLNPLYSQIYKVYMYAVFMTFLPFGILLSLNCLIIWKIYRMPREKTTITITRYDSINSDINKFHDDDTSANESTIMLVMVVALFLVCNSIALVVNIIETFGNYPMEDPDAANRLFFVIDVGNFLVVFNSSANFLIYYAFSESFRDVLTRDRRKVLGRFAASFTSLHTQYYLANSSININEEDPTKEEVTKQLNTTHQQSAMVGQALQGITTVATSIAVTPQESSTTPPQLQRAYNKNVITYGKTNINSSQPRGAYELLSVKRISPTAMLTVNYEPSKYDYKKYGKRSASLQVPTLI